MTPEQILANFFVFDNFNLRSEGAEMEFVAERLRGEVARFDIVDKSGKVIVERQAYQRQACTRHRAAGLKHISVPEDYLLGRVLAKNIVDPDTGEVIANANDELTEEVLAAARSRRDRHPDLYTNDLDQGAYISQTLRIDDTADQTAARVAIYRMMRPGEPPTEEPWKRCSTACSTAPTVTTCRRGPHEVQPPHRP
jgi:DNA-directed RNA polymerase subunit beta